MKTGFKDLTGVFFTIKLQTGRLVAGETTDCNIFLINVIFRQIELIETMTRVTFLHPDLGIGGAERLVVDAALALKKQGYEVNFVTTHHDADHCFSETKDGTIPVTVVGNWLPRHIFGRFFALFAYIRMVIHFLHTIQFTYIYNIRELCSLHDR